MPKSRSSKPRRSSAKGRRPVPISTLNAQRSTLNPRRSLWIGGMALVVVLCGLGGVTRLAALGRARTPPEFNSPAAFARLRAQCDFGPRVPGTPGHARCLEYLVNALKETTSD